MIKKKKQVEMGEKTNPRRHSIYYCCVQCTYSNYYRNARYSSLPTREFYSGRPTLGGESYKHTHTQTISHDKILFFMSFSRIKYHIIMHPLTSGF